MKICLLTVGNVGYDMTDISKCEGTDCKNKEKCYRYTAIAATDRQSYSSFYKDLKNKDPQHQCDYFWLVND